VLNHTQEFLQVNVTHASVEVTSLVAEHVWTDACKWVS